jgi:hypothetical protein
MNDTFSIKSTTSDREICFSKYDGEDFIVEVKGNVSGSTKVYGYAPHTDNLAHWFSELGLHAEGWVETKTWESLEGEFKLSASCSSLGQVHFELSLRMLQGADEEAYIKVGLETELGQIEGISNEASRFFESKST